MHLYLDAALMIHRTGFKPFTEVLGPGLTTHQGLPGEEFVILTFCEAIFHITLFFFFPLG